MKRIAIALLIVAAVGCTQKPKPVAAEQPVAPEDRQAISVEYVAIPTLEVRQSPDLNAAVLSTYSYSEAMSVMSHNGEWAEVRTGSGFGWVKSNELMTGEQEKVNTANKNPRFYQPPVAVPRNVRGSITYQLKVNTDGQIYDVQMLSNTTGIQSLADENTEAIKKARFYPLMDQGQRKGFIYQHVVYYPVLQ